MHARVGGRGRGRAPHAPVAPPLAQPMGAPGLLQLQRTAGNRATSLLVQRAPVLARGVVTGYTFVVGTELSVAFAQAAKAAVRDGSVDATELSSLRTSALADESVDDHERMFLAGLLDRRNAQRLQRMNFGATGDTITFPAGSITPSRRASVAAIDRPTMPAAVTALEQAAAAAMRGLDLPLAFAHLTAAQSAAVATISTITGSHVREAVQAMTLAQAQGLYPAELLAGMLAAASDGTAGDLAQAATVITIAHAEGLPILADLMAGRVKVDQVPAARMPGGATHNADYISIAQGVGAKGDTVYLPTGASVTDAYQWSVVVHELQHVADDKAAGGGRVQWADRARTELAGYRAQGASIIRRLAATSGADRTTMVSQLATRLDPLLLGGMLVATRGSSATADPLITLINNQAPAAQRAPAAGLTAAFAVPVAAMETRLLALIAQAYGFAPGARIALDGLSGDSIVDWINRT